MDGRVIPLPGGRGLGNAAPTADASAEQISVLSVELKPVDADAPQLARTIIERIHERCIRAALPSPRPPGSGITLPSMPGVSAGRSVA